MKTTASTGNEVIELRQLLSERFPGMRTWTENPTARAQSAWPTGLPQLDSLLQNGLPKGAITELVSTKSASGSALFLRALSGGLRKPPVDRADRWPGFVRCHGSAAGGIVAVALGPLPGGGPGDEGGGYYFARPQSAHSDTRSQNESRRANAKDNRHYMVSPATAGQPATTALLVYGPPDGRQRGRAVDARKPLQAFRNVAG